MILQSSTQKSYGTMFRSFRRKNAKKAACWNVRQKWFPVLPHMVPGYISEDMKDLEQIVGLQTDKPLKHAFMPYGGIRMAVQAAETCMMM